MPENFRYYIASQSDPGSFVKKIILNNHLFASFLRLYDYQPNISNYPLSFTSLDSIRDHIETIMFSEIQSGALTEIGYTHFNEMLHISIVKMHSFENDCGNPQPIYEQTHINNIQEYVKKAAFKYLSFQLFGEKFTALYYKLTNFNSRSLGDCSGLKNYIVDPGKSKCYEMNNRFYNLGLNFWSDFETGLISVYDSEGLNLAKLSIEGAEEWKVIPADTIAGLERQVYYSNPLYLANLDYYKNIH